MGADQHYDWRASVASTLDWWREAGVDALVDELPCDWLAPAEPIPARALLADTPAPAALPTSLEAYAPWRLGPDTPDARWPGQRLGPEGDATAGLWIVIDGPDRDDLAAGRLLSGKAGVLFERMLAAIGRTREAVFLVPLCTARAPGGRRDDAEAKLAELLRHHLALGRPSQALLLGDAASRALLQTSCAAARGALRAINHEGAEATVVVASFHPRFLLDRPAFKAEAWRDLQMLVGGR